MALPNTHIGPEGITSLLAGKKKLFFAGIGGVSMNSLAAVSRLRGYEVAGYDRTPSEITRRHEKMGIAVYYEADMIVDSACCAGVTPAKHEAALETMRSCQIVVR